MASKFVSDVLHKNIESFLSDSGIPESNTVAKVAVGGILTVSAYATLKVVNAAFGTDPIGRTSEMFGKFSVQEKNRNIEVNSVIEGYNKLHEDDLAERNTAYTTLVNSYYELATLFYEWGWGQSFHFAYQLKGESFQEAIARHEYFLAGRLGVKQGDKVIDVGCGVGGPMRNIARYVYIHHTCSIVYLYLIVICMLVGSLELILQASP